MDIVTDKYLLHAISYPLVLLVCDRQMLPLCPPIGIIDWWLKGELTKLFTSGKFKANEGEVLLFTTTRFKKNKNFLLFGIGDINDLSSEKGEHLLFKLKNQLSSLNLKNFLLVPSKNLLKESDFLKKYFKNFLVDLYLA